MSLSVKPEILRADANHSQTSDPGPALVLFALVRSSPPATVSFVDQSGQSVAHATDLLLLDSQTSPWLANHTLRITLSSLSGNLSLNVSSGVGTVQSNLTLAGQGAARQRPIGVRLGDLNGVWRSVPRIPAVSGGGAHAGDCDGGRHGLHGPPGPDLDRPLPHAEKQEQVCR